MSGRTGHPTTLAVQLRGVRHDYDGGNGALRALDTIDLDIAPGEFVSILGPSGCGKSTLLRLIAGFLEPTQGEVKADGVAVDGPSPERGVVFQQPSLYPWLDVRGNVEFGLKMRRVGRAERRAIADRYLELVGLQDFARARPYELSGGMQQRCQLARVLATEPRTILMDEPFGALDALTREQLQGELRSIWTREQRTVVLITHSVDEAVLLGTRLVIMSARPGRIVLDEPLPFVRSGRQAAELRADRDFVAVCERARALIG